MAAPNELYNAEFMEHVTHPDYKYVMDDATDEHEGVNPTCGDDLKLQIKLGDDGKIEEAAYTGHGCAVSMASADMMADLMIDKTPAEATALCELFMNMVRGEETDDGKLEELDEAKGLKSVSHMPARVKCAELAWRTLEEMLKEEKPTEPTTTE